MDNFSLFPLYNFAALSEKYGDALDATLIANDPEVDIELIGRPIEKTNTIYLDSENNIMQMAPEWIESILDVNGIEKEQRKPQDRFSNIAEEIPIRFTKKRLKKSEAIHRFAFTRTVQLWHSDGLTYEFLHGIAEDLDKSKEMMLLGGGSKAKEPLIFQLNGLPWRAFLEGRISEEGYCLLLRLSNLELKPFSK